MKRSPTLWLAHKCDGAYYRSNVDAFSGDAQGSEMALEDLKVHYDQVGSREGLHCRRPSYAAIFANMRAYFHYESPLPVDDALISKKSRSNFADASALFNFNLEKQVILWQDSTNACLSEELWPMLTDGQFMYNTMDRAFLFCFLKHIRPKRLLEIGSGESTVVAQQALKRNANQASHICIEPYRAHLVPKGVRTIKKEMQEVDRSVFTDLDDGDVLFIDSSHVIMPYGDTLTEFVTVLPYLRKGVYVHVHDIFLPFDYPADWQNKNKVYTEQWALFLLLQGAEQEWEIVWSSNLMVMQRPKVLAAIKGYPPDARFNGGSFWIRKLRDPPMRARNSATSK